MKTIPDRFAFPWSHDDSEPRRPADVRAAGLRMPQSPHQQKADRTTLAVREMTDQATVQRNAKTAKLRQARLERDAAAEATKAAAPPPAPKAKRVSAKKAAPAG